ncbi:hypothetical protein D3C86_840080 [compost metagenome]
MCTFSSVLVSLYVQPGDLGLILTHLLNLLVKGQSGYQISNTLFKGKIRIHVGVSVCRVHSNTFSLSF